MEYNASQLEPSRVGLPAFYVQEGLCAERLAPLPAHNWRAALNACALPAVDDTMSSSSKSSASQSNASLLLMKQLKGAPCGKQARGCQGSGVARCGLVMVRIC